MRSYKKLRYLEIERMSNWGWHRLLLMFVLISHFLFFSFPLSLNAQQKRTTKRVVKKTVKSRKPKTNSQNTTSVQALEKQRQQIQQQIKEQERRLRNNVQDVRKRLNTLIALNTEIEGKRRTIDTIRKDISSLDIETEMLLGQFDLLQEKLDKTKKNYVKSMRYMHRNRSAQNQLMFIFSADNLTQLVRRLRFMREYASYQRVQGERVKAEEEEVNRKFQEIANAQQHKQVLLTRGEQERQSLEGKQIEQKQVVQTLQKEQKTIQGIIAQQKKKDAALNAQIDRLIAEEVARQKARAAAEAKRRAEAEAAKKRAAELARKKAAAEAAARENARRIAEAARLAAEKKADAEAREHAKEVATARKEAEAVLNAPTEDMRISGSFESNRGRLPIPITGGYRIVSHFGQYNVEGLHNVTLDNKGINIQGSPGAQARSIFDGEVSAVFSFGGTMVVMVRHGSYISVYCNLANVNVHRGQKVTTRQTLGRLGQDNILQFQLRRETAKLNPESWLGR